MRPRQFIIELRTFPHLFLLAFQQTDKSLFGFFLFHNTGFLVKKGKLVFDKKTETDWKTFIALTSDNAWSVASMATWLWVALISAPPNWLVKLIVVMQDPVSMFLFFFYFYAFCNFNSSQILYTFQHILIFLGFSQKQSLHGFKLVFLRDSLQTLFQKLYVPSCTECRDCVLTFSISKAFVSLPLPF